MPTRLDRLAAHLSAKQTAALCICGGLVSASGCLAELPIRPARLHHPHIAFWLWTVAAFGLMIFGFVITVFARSELESGIANDRWPANQIESLRNLVSKELVVWCGIAALIAMFLLFIFNPHLSPIYWAFFILNQSLAQLSFATRGPRDSATTWIGISTARWPDDTQALAPIQSNHWGQR